MNKLDYACKMYQSQLILKTDIASYMFTDPVQEIFSLHDLMYYDKNIQMPNILVNKQIRFVLQNYKRYFDKFAEAKNDYWIYYKSYHKLTNELGKSLNKYINERIKRMFKKIKYSKGTKNPSTGEKIVLQCLEKIASKYELYYFYKYKWPFIKNKNTLEYDFYCILIHNGYVIQWVIEFDGDQHVDDITRFNFNNIHKHDILKQYYLHQLNIHLLRLNNNSDIGQSIEKFINKILITSKYVVMNEIIPDKKKFIDKSNHNGLIHFYNFYKDAHKKAIFIDIEELDEKVEFDQISLDVYDDDFNKVVLLKKNYVIRL